MPVYKCDRPTVETVQEQLPASTWKRKGIDTLPELSQVTKVLEQLQYLERYVSHETRFRRDLVLFQAARQVSVPAHHRAKKGTGVASLCCHVRVDQVRTPEGC